MMHEYIRQELWLFSWGMVFGGSLALLYDGFRILRRVIVHSLVWIAIEDVLYWFICANLTFLFLLMVDHGRMRLCVILAAIIGVAIYQTTISRLLVKYVSKGLICMIAIIKKWKRRLTEPIAKGIMKLCKHFHKGNEQRNRKNESKKTKGKRKTKKNGISNPTKK